VDGGSKRPYTIHGTERFASRRFARLAGKQANRRHAAAASLARAARAGCTEKQREFVGRLPQRYHSQGSRPKVIEFPGGVRVTVSIPYFHRQKDPAKVAAKPGRGLFPALMLLGIVKGRTPHVRQRMVKAAALLGSFEEAAEMLADSCVKVSVNALREGADSRFVGREIQQNWCR